MVNLPTEVNFYADKLYQGDVVNLFTTADFRFHAIIFTGNTKAGFFGFKKLLISRIKKKLL